LAVATAEVVSAALAAATSAAADRVGAGDGLNSNR
jgi:hypothetical protein